MIRSRFQSTLKQFVESSNHFKVVYSTVGTGKSNFKRVLILDSSFNPPHQGHHSIVKKALEHQGFESSVVLLLLSVKNADKVVPKPAAFEDRLNMMRLLADDLNSQHNAEVHVGLTKHAKFVDKSNSIRGYFATESIYTFLIGFDTLIRILDEKYYTPLSLKQSLNDFMKNNELFCLTRLNDESFDIKDQLKYYNDIRTGAREPEIPRDWSESIYMVSGDDATLGISSSEIRRDIENGNQLWKKSVISEVEQYITTNNIYKDE